MGDQCIELAGESQEKSCKVRGSIGDDSNTILTLTKKEKRFKNLEEKF
jgi:hypothetical protein